MSSWSKKIWDRFTRKNETKKQETTLADNMIQTKKKKDKWRLGERFRQLFRKEKDDDVSTTQSQTKSQQQKTVDKFANVRKTLKELQTTPPTNLVNVWVLPETFRTSINGIVSLTDFLMDEKNYKDPNKTFFPLDDEEDCQELYNDAKKVLIQNNKKEIWDHTLYEGKDLKERIPLALEILNLKYSHVQKKRGGRKTRCGKKRKGGRRHKKRHLTRKR